jgi:heterodisulfide reductase subunit A-like polyferredoxin
MKDRNSYLFGLSDPQTLDSHFPQKKWINLSAPVPEETNFIQLKNVRHAGGKGEELWFQSQEDQELSAAPGARQLIMKMSSDHQTVDHTNKDTNFENSVEKTIGCVHLRLDMFPSVCTSLTSKITRLHLLSDLATTFL